MDLIYWMKFLGSIATTFIVYQLFVHDRRPVYILTALKKIYAERKIKRKQKLDRLNLTHDLKKYQSEAPKILPNGESSDSQLIFGSDDKGNSLLIKFTRRRHRVAEVWLVLRLINGQVYCLPQHPNTTVLNATPRIFEGAGLKLECLVPYARWRISFSGMLKGKDEMLQFVKMNFIWTTASNPSFWPQDWSPKIIANCLANEPWRDGKWMQLIRMKDSGGYDQFGACHGEVKIYDQNSSCYVEGFLPKVEVLELNLPGLRQRRWGPYKSKHLLQTGVLMGSITDGCNFEIGAFSAKYGLTHSQFGNVRFPNGSVHPIDSTDFSLKEYQINIPDKKKIQIETDGKKIEVLITFKNVEKILLCGENYEDNWSAFIIPTEIEFNGRPGLGCAIFWQPKNVVKFSIQELPTIVKRIFNSHDQPSRENLIHEFTDNEAQSVAVAGGKGSSLAILKKIQETTGDFQLPSGFIISVSAFDEHLENHPEIRKTLQHLEDVAYQRIPGDLKETCEAVKSTFKSSSLNNSLKKVIADKLKEISNQETIRFTVRSSGITEDGEESSTAGQNETFLGLQKIDDIFEAVLKCWASLYSFQSVHYRKQHIQPVITKISVVVQEMVVAEAAGVLFTRHPLNGDPSVSIITANYGLGESVVSAKADPDTFLVKRSYNDEVEILGTKAGEKKIVIEMDGENSVKEVELDEDTRKKLCLTIETALELAKLGVYMEKAFGTPRDIEFAVTKNKTIFLLQSRPITALNNFSDFEIVHEFNSAVMGPEEVYTRVNVGEVILGPLSVFTQSTLTKALEKDMLKMINDGKKGAGGLYNNFIPIFHHHMFMNVGMLYIANVSSKISKSDRITTLSTFGIDIFEKYPELFEIAQHRNVYKKSNAMIQLKIMYEAIFLIDKYLEEMREVYEQVKVKFSKENLKKLKNPIEICNVIEQGMEVMTLISSRHLTASSNSIIYQTFAFSTLIDKSERPTTTHQSDVALILGSISDVESANIPEMIQEIAEKIISSQKRDDFLKVETSNGLEWLKENCSEAFELFKAFLVRHGHRAINEMDVIAVPWENEPEKILEMIKSNLSLGELSAGKTSKKLSDDEILNKLQTPMGKVQRMIMKKLLPRCRKGVQNREIAKTRMVGVINEIRKVVKHLGQTMLHEGLLPDEELIFHMSLNEIKDVILSRDSRLISKAMQRQKMFLKLKELKFDEISFNFPQPIPLDIQTNVDAKTGDVLVKGTPVCGGIVTATACVCKSFDDVHKIKRGDILITYGTDIGWSPYFPILNGVVTEIGGLVSHGAVVAREYGLPCVIAATCATDKIKNGQTITLNANNGTITSAE